MIRQKYYPYFFAWFFFSALFVQILVFVMSSLQVDPNYGYVLNFDQIFMGQITYFTIWTNLGTGLWALVNWIRWGISKHKKTALVLNKQIFVMMVTFNFFLPVAFYGALIFYHEAVVAFSTWWQIVKSTIEHLITPILFIVFYFLVDTKKVTTKNYASKWLWVMVVIPTIYLIFVISRSFLMHAHVTMPNPPAILFFPYPMLDPYVNPAYVSVLLVLCFYASALGFGVLMNFLSNITLDSLHKKQHHVLPEEEVVPKTLNNKRK